MNGRGALIMNLCFMIENCNSRSPLQEASSPSSEDVDARLRRLCLDEHFDPSNQECITQLFQTIENVDELEVFIQKATNLLDSVETDLVEEVSVKSDSFYDAISAIGSLTDQTSSLYAAAHNISMLLVDLEKSYLNEIDELERLTNSQAIIVEAQHKLAVMMEFVKSQGSIQDMLDAHSFTDALKLVNSKIHLLETELAGIEIFDENLLELREMKVALEKMENAIAA